MLRVALMPDRLEDLQRHVGVGGALHVDAHEEPVLDSGIENAPQVVHAGGAIDVEAELRQLHRHVALDVGQGDRLQDLAVVARGLVRLLHRGDALAEIVERQEQAAAGERPHGGDGVLDRLSGDESARESAAALRHAVARRETLQQVDSGEGVKKGLRRGVEHQCVEPSGVSRC